MSELEPISQRVPDSVSDTDDSFDSVEASAAKPPAREGLPKAYCMRADAHYVDLLTSRSSPGRERMLPISAIESPPRPDASSLTPLVDSIARHGVLQPLLVQERRGGYRLIAGLKRLSAAFAAGLNEVPCRLYEVDDHEAGRLAAAARVTVYERGAAPVSDDDSADAHLARALRTLTACANMIAAAEGELPRTVAGNLLRAEAWRASCLLHARQVLKGHWPVTSALVSVPAIPAGVIASFAAERDVRHVTFESELHVPSGTSMLSDERLLSGALAGAVIATLGVVDKIAGARVTIGVRAEAADQVSFIVSQNNLAMPDAWFSRAFEPTWVDRPGGLPAALALAAVQHAAALLGGEASASRCGRGTAVGMRIPVVGSR